MKLWMTTDSHFGVKNNSEEWLEIARSYYYDFFIPEVSKRKGPTDILVHMGDVFDSRNAINISVMCFAKHLFKDLAALFPEGVYVICGNHDTYRKDTNEINSLVILEGIKNVHLIVNEEEVLRIHDKDIALLPWQLSSKHEKETLKGIKDSDYLLAHTSVIGALYSGTRRVEHGNKPESYADFGQVYTGHIHTSQKIKNVRFNGSPYEITRNDRGNQKSIWGFDIKTGKEIQIINTFSPKHLSINYDSLLGKEEDEIKKIIKNNFVDVNVSSEIKDTKELDNFMDMLSNTQSRDTKIKFIDKSLTPDSIDIDVDISKMKEQNNRELVKEYLSKKGYKDSLIEKLVDYIEIEMKKLEG
jgi:DNA repair exonuclease SbcCD nuclease subunit